MSPDTTIGAATRDVTPSSVSRRCSSAGTPGSSVARRAGAPVRATSASATAVVDHDDRAGARDLDARLAPLADDDPFVLARAEANEVRGVGAEEASDLLGHDVEDPLRCRLGRDGHRDAVQGRLLGDERAEVDLVPRHAESSHASRRTPSSHDPERRRVERVSRRSRRTQVCRAAVLAGHRIAPRTRQTRILGEEFADRPRRRARSARTGRTSSAFGCSLRTGPASRPRPRRRP